MTKNPLRALVVAVAALGALSLWAGLGASRVQADDAGKLVARSVCEAHELKARQAADPSLQIEIPPEFESPWPSRSACLSHAAAEDPSTPGPLQPIPFSHKHHAGQFQIDCQYCHSGTDASPAAGVPSVELCMGCHAQFPPTYDELAGIQTLKKAWEAQEPIEWVQVYRLPEYVQFQHRAHIMKGFDCQECHGQVQEMDKDNDATPDYLDLDSDDDTYSDFLEWIVGTDPYDPNSFPPATLPLRWPVAFLVFLVGGGWAVQRVSGMKNKSNRIPGTRGS